MSELRQVHPHMPGEDFGRDIESLVRWMLEVIEARDSDARARTVNLKFSSATIRMWATRAGEALRELSVPAVSEGAPTDAPRDEEWQKCVNDLLATVRLAVMDGYNEKPLTTADDWMEEVKKRVLLLWLASRRSSVPSAPTDAPTTSTCPTCGCTTVNSCAFCGANLPQAAPLDEPTGSDTAMLREKGYDSAQDALDTIAGLSKRVASRLPQAAPAYDEQAERLWTECEELATEMDGAAVVQALGRASEIVWKQGHDQRFHETHSGKPLALAEASSFDCIWLREWVKQLREAKSRLPQAARGDVKLLTPDEIMAHINDSLAAKEPLPVDKMRAAITTLYEAAQEAQRQLAIWEANEPCPECGEKHICGAQAALREAAGSNDAPLDQLLDDAGQLLREPLDFASPNTWADVRNARSKIAEAYKLVAAGSAPNDDERRAAILTVRRIADLLCGYRQALREGGDLHANDFGKDPEQLYRAAEVLERSSPDDANELLKSVAEAITFLKSGEFTDDPYGGCEAAWERLERAESRYYERAGTKSAGQVAPSTPSVSGGGE